MIRARCDPYQIWSVPDMIRIRYDPYPIWSASDMICARYDPYPIWYASDMIRARYDPYPIWPVPDMIRARYDPYPIWSISDITRVRCATNSYWHKFTQLFSLSRAVHYNTLEAENVHYIKEWWWCWPYFTVQDSPIAFSPCKLYLVAKRFLPKVSTAVQFGNNPYSLWKKEICKQKNKAKFFFFNRRWILIKETQYTLTVGGRGPSVVVFQHLIQDWEWIQCRRCSKKVE
jgi:hypothetical protein